MNRKTLDKIGKIVGLLFILIVQSIATLALYNYWPASYGDYRNTAYVYQPYFPSYGMSGFSSFHPTYYRYSYRFYSNDPDYRDYHRYNYRPYYRSPERYYRD